MHEREKFAQKMGQCYKSKLEADYANTLYPFTCLLCFCFVPFSLHILTLTSDLALYNIRPNADLNSISRSEQMESSCKSKQISLAFR